MAFERLTKRGRGAIQRAFEHAQRLNHDTVGADHILLGVLDDPDSLAVLALSSLGVNTDEARDTVRAATPRGDGVARGGTPRVSAEGKKVLEQALREARHLRHRYIGTEHLLLALLQAEGSVASFFEKLRVTPDEVRDSVSRVLADAVALQSHGGDPVGGALAEMEGASAPQPEARGNVVMCRISDRDLQAIDILMESRVCGTRSEAAAWLIRAGIATNTSLFDTLNATVMEIRRLQEQARTMIHDVQSKSAS